MATESDREERQREFQSRLHTVTRAIMEKENSLAVTPFLVPILKRRYAGRQNLAVLEVGPGYSTAVPETLSNSLGTYVALDQCELYLNKQRELLAGVGGLAGKVFSVKGSTYCLPFPSGSQDLVVAICHNPVYEWDEELRVKALTELRRVLKPNGELVIFPWHFHHRYYDCLIWEEEEELSVVFEAFRTDFLRTIHKRLRTRPLLDLFAVAEVENSTYYGACVVLRKRA